jgi:hypothetical protein
MPPDAERPQRDDADLVRRVACAEINGRRVNEAIERGADGRDPIAFLCECGRLGCTTKLRLTHREYEGVRVSFERFLLAPGHAVEGIDTVVEEHPAYAVATKHGYAAMLAHDADERAVPDA